LKKFITLNTNSKITTVGLDLAKNSFSLHAFDEAGNTVLAKDLKRGQVLSFFEKLEPCRVGLEACASAHCWARELIKLGHDVKLIPAQRVKAFLPRMKNDAQDAKAIARALRDPEMRFVSVKNVEQQALLMLLKARDLLMGQRTSLINAVRGHFGEIGIVFPQGAHEEKVLVQLVLQDDQQMRLSQLMRDALKALVASLSNLEGEIKVLNGAIAKQHKSNEQSHHLKVAS
jgi:transposase